MSVEVKDARIGYSSPDGMTHIEPRVCAVSGQSVRGRHQEQHRLRDDGYYYAVLIKYKGKEPTDLHQQMLALLPPAPEPANDENYVPPVDAEKDARATFSTGEVLTDEEAASVPPAVTEPPASKRVKK